MSYIDACAPRYGTLALPRLPCSFLVFCIKNTPCDPPRAEKGNTKKRNRLRSFRFPFLQQRVITISMGVLLFSKYMQFHLLVPGTTLPQRAAQPTFCFHSEVLRPASMARNKESIAENPGFVKPGCPCPHRPHWPPSVRHSKADWLAFPGSAPSAGSLPPPAPSRASTAWG